MMYILYIIYIYIQYWGTRLSILSTGGISISPSFHLSLRGSSCRIFSICVTVMTPPGPGSGWCWVFCWWDPAGTTFIDKYSIWMDPSWVMNMGFMLAKRDTGGVMFWNQTCCHRRTHQQQGMRTRNHREFTVDLPEIAVKPDARSVAQRFRNTAGDEFGFCSIKITWNVGAMNWDIALLCIMHVVHPIISHPEQLSEMATQSIYIY